MADQTGTNEPDPTLSTDERVPPSSEAASAPARGGFTLRGRTWVYGATLAAAGVLAGSRVTYAVVSATT